MQSDDATNRETIQADQVLARIAADPNDEAAWVDVLDLFQERWLRSAYAILGSPDLADDALQNALLCLRDHAADFQAPRQKAAAAACAWMQRIVTNSALQLLRSRVRQHKRDREQKTVIHNGGFDQKAADPVDILQDQDLLERIQHYQALLPERHQVSLSLYYAAELNYEETAAALQCSVNSARVRVHRALKALRALLLRSGITCTLWSLSNLLQSMPYPTAMQSQISFAHIHQAQAIADAGILQAALPGPIMSVAMKTMVASCLIAGVLIGGFAVVHMSDEADAQTIGDPSLVEEKPVDHAEHLQTVLKWSQLFWQKDAEALQGYVGFPFWANGQKPLQTVDAMRGHLDAVWSGPQIQFLDVQPVVRHFKVMSAKQMESFRVLVQQKQLPPLPVSCDGYVFSLTQHASGVEIEAHKQDEDMRAVQASATVVEQEDKHMIVLFDAKQHRIVGYAILSEGQLHEL